MVVTKDHRVKDTFWKVRKTKNGGDRVSCICVFWKEVYCTDIGKKNSNGQVFENDKGKPEQTKNYLYLSHIILGLWVDALSKQVLVLSSIVITGWKRIEYP